MGVARKGNEEMVLPYKEIKTINHNGWTRREDGIFLSQTLF